MKSSPMKPPASSASVSGGPSSSSSSLSPPMSNPVSINAFGLSQALEEWIWEDNMNFIQDNNIFDHTYFNFMWQMVSYIPNTLNPEASTTLATTGQEDITLLAVKL